MCSENDTTTNDPTAHSDDETRAGESERSADRWLGGADVLDARLPADLRSALGDFVGRESVDTLGEWAAEIRRFAGDGTVDIDQLCRDDGGTDHWGTVDGERYHFRCFYDAVVLAALEERPVDVRTVSPGGTVVEAHADGRGELSVTPGAAVFSVGIATDAGERSGGDPTLEDGYAAVCPYVRAFPDREAYEQWADDAPAATVAMPLSGATELADALVA
ncbi:organomercurial lyase [Halomicrobium salinisoli]|uniref:organomercurial lyase n=1 Tax=Halomicrobium salinisoli TaxID=2878391 RepID=UPI001CF0AACD|nr:organomercurial lyase [Halomicrobium salinisoli]